MACSAINSGKGAECSQLRLVNEPNPITLKTATRISTAAPSSGELIFPGTPIQSTPMNQSAMAAPIVTRYVSDDPNNATYVATTTAALAVSPTAEGGSKVIFCSSIVVF